jgi:hypothetical protein
VAGYVSRHQTAICDETGSCGARQVRAAEAHERDAQDGRATLDRPWDRLAAPVRRGVEEGAGKPAQGEEDGCRTCSPLASGARVESAGFSTENRSEPTGAVSPVGPVPLHSRGQITGKTPRPAPGVVVAGAAMGRVPTERSRKSREGRRSRPGGLDRGAQGPAEALAGLGHLGSACAGRRPPTTRDGLPERVGAALEGLEGFPAGGGALNRAALQGASSGLYEGPRHVVGDPCWQRHAQRRPGSARVLQAATVPVPGR